MFLFYPKGAKFMEQIDCNSCSFCVKNNSKLMFLYTHDCNTDHKQHIKQSNGASKKCSFFVNKKTNNLCLIKKYKIEKEKHIYDNDIKNRTLEINLNMDDSVELKQLDDIGNTNKINQPIQVKENVDKKLQKFFGASNNENNYKPGILFEYRKNNVYAVNSEIDVLNTCSKQEGKPITQRNDTNIEKCGAKEEESDIIKRKKKLNTRKKENGRRKRKEKVLEKKREDACKKALQTYKKEQLSKKSKFDLSQNWFSFNAAKRISDLPDILRDEFLEFCNLTGFFNPDDCFRAMRLTVFNNKHIRMGIEMQEQELKKIQLEKAEILKERIASNNFPLEQKLNKSVFEIKNSSIHGKGVFTKMKIPDDAFLFCYEGEIIGKCMSDKREKEYKANGITSIYMFTVEEDIILDATKIGNWARFVNHSCESNCDAIYCVDSGKIKYFTKRVIEKNEEITINYMSKKVLDITDCNCGSSRCRSNKAKLWKN